MTHHATPTRAARVLARSLRVLLLFSFCAALSPAAFAQPEPPKYPDEKDKAALVKYQEDLETWGNAAAANEEAFWNATAEGYYKSTKALLKLELTSEERRQYSEQFAGILGSYALNEAEKNGGFGEKFNELTREAAQAGKEYAEGQTDETLKIFLAYVKQQFSVRLKRALALPNAERDGEFVSIVGDAVTFALAVPEFGETTNSIVTTVRTFSPELGEEALDAMCESFEASGKPALVKPIQKTLGLRRYARMVGEEPYFEAMELDGDEFTKKFDWKEHENKVVLIEVWATWCGPCRREIPRLKEVYEKYHAAGLDIVGYSIDQDLDALKKFLVDNEIPWPMTSQKKSEEAGYKGLYEYYSINGVPEMILVGRDGKVVMTDARGCKLADALKELFPDVEPLGWDPATDFSQRVASPDK